MPQSVRHSSHHVYPFELFGNTLVVRPRGDAIGFALHDVRTEMAHVRELAQNPLVRHLLIDLSAENYFGSMVLGDLVEFGQLVRSRGGRTGLCGASPELLAVLRLMQLDDQWEMFPTTEAGLHTVATVPIAQRLWRLRWVGACLMAACLAVAAIAYWPRVDRGAQYTAQLVELWNEFETRHALAGVEESERITRKVRTRLEPVVADLARRGHRKPLTPIEQSVLFAVRPWLKALDLTGEEAQRKFDEARYYLNCAEAQIAGGPPPYAALPLAVIPNPEDAHDEADRESPLDATEVDASPAQSHDG
jgi:anti-anti-sigma factor